MEKFRLLRADEIECRISLIKETGLALLLYKTARTDANLLDETVGPENWENDFKVINNVLYGGIGIRFEDREIWKWDAGTESNTEAEKGRASDAFKRAGFKWGIGRELYSAPFIWIPASECEIKNNKCYDRFEVSEIGYNEKNEICKLSITNATRRKTVFSMGAVSCTAEHAKINQRANTAGIRPVEAPDGYYYCESCGDVIGSFKSKGQTINPKDFAINTISRYGKQLCKNCAKAAKDEGAAA